jgi:hypothetical protein
MMSDIPPWLLHDFGGPPIQILARQALENLVPLYMDIKCIQINCLNSVSTDMRQYNRFHIHIYAARIYSTLSQPHNISRRFIYDTLRALISIN